jgi:hypothetical protein
MLEAPHDPSTRGGELIARTSTASVAAVGVEEV